LFLVSEDLGIHDPGMVIDRGMQERIADLDRRVPVLASCRSPQSPPATTIRNPAQFLHIDMHEIARIRMLIADDDPPLCAPAGLGW
jgi:hypothetical protein